MNKITREDWLKGILPPAPSEADSELILLRGFFVAWQAFHRIPKDRQHRRQHENAAQDMVDAANTLKHFYEAQRPKLEVVK